jgi:hypothetical protein
MMDTLVGERVPFSVRRCFRQERAGPAHGAAAPRTPRTLGGLYRSGVRVFLKGMPLQWPPQERPDGGVFASPSTTMSLMQAQRQGELPASGSIMPSGRLALAEAPALAAFHCASGTRDVRAVLVSSMPNRMNSARSPDQDSSFEAEPARMVKTTAGAVETGASSHTKSAGEHDESSAGALHGGRRRAADPASTERTKSRSAVSNFATFVPGAAASPGLPRNQHSVSPIGGICRARFQRQSSE